MPSPVAGTSFRQPCRRPAPSAQAHEDPPDAPALAAPELSAGRPLAVLGYFPEAPWRAGLVVGVLDPKGLWAILDASGRVHSLAARASLAISLGATRRAGAARPVSPAPPLPLGLGGG